MKFTYAAVLFAASVSAQTIASETAMLPSCADTCLTTAIAASGCGATDYECQCGTGKDAITESATPCIVSACTTDEALEVQSITAEICTLEAAISATAVASSSTAAATAASSSVSSAASASTSAASAASSASSASASSASATSASASSASASSASASATTVTTSSGNVQKQASGLVGVMAMAFAFVL